MFACSLPDALPKGLTELERELIPQFQFTGNRLMSDPPTGPVRAAADRGGDQHLPRPHLGRQECAKQKIKVYSVLCLHLCIV